MKAESGICVNVLLTTVHDSQFFAFSEFYLTFGLWVLWRVFFLPQILCEWSADKPWCTLLVDDKLIEKTGIMNPWFISKIRNWVILAGKLLASVESLRIRAIHAIGFLAAMRRDVVIVLIHCIRVQKYCAAEQYKAILQGDSTNCGSRNKEL